MAEIIHQDESIKNFLNQKNYMAAVMLAKKLGHPEIEIRQLKELALKQMACDYRNGFAVQRLAKEWGFSKADLENLLMAAIDEYEMTSDKRLQEQRYDAKTGRYLTLKQWIERFLSTNDYEKSVKKHKSRHLNNQ